MKHNCVLHRLKMILMIFEFPSVRVFDIADAAEVSYQLSDHHQHDEIQMDQTGDHWSEAVKSASNLQACECLNRHKG